MSEARKRARKSVSKPARKAAGALFGQSPGKPAGKAAREPDVQAADARNTAVGRLPADWGIRLLGELASSEGRYGSPAPAQPYDADLPRYIRITDMGEDGTLRPSSLASISAEEAASYQLEPGDLLFARSGSTVGKTYLYDERDGECAHAGYVIRFPLQRERCEPSFVARWTQSSFYQRWVRSTLRQAAQPNINASEYAALPVPSPPLHEQRAIARVLEKMDQVIGGSERIVAKLEVVLRGLVHDLLTRGVAPNGKLRPRATDPGADPAAFVDTPLGKLPRHFRVAPIAELLADVDPAMRSGPFGSALLKSELVREGIPLLGIDNIGVDRFVPERRRFVSHGKFHELRRFAVRPGDVMVTIMGTVGRSCLVPADIGEALSSKHVWTLTFDPGQYAPLLACLQLNYARWVHEHFRRDEQGGTMAAIRSETLRTTLLPVPPPGEQRLIMEVLELCRTRLRAEQDALERRKQLRKALLEDLLMGRVRGAERALPDGPDTAPAAHHDGRGS